MEQESDRVCELAEKPSPQQSPVSYPLPVSLHLIISFISAKSDSE